jgi:lipopolysaccharide transport protein LptA
MLKLNHGCQIVLLAMVILPSEASSAGDRMVETVSITADEAYEDIQPGILHFNGQFLMRSGDWQLESTRATVYGKPDRPDKVYLEGSPARFLIKRQQGDAQDSVEAAAPRVTYQRSGSLLRLSGGSVLMLDGEVIRSDVIEYNISTNRYRAEGVDGVMIEVPPS